MADIIESLNIAKLRNNNGGQKCFLNMDKPFELRKINGK